MPPSTRNSSKRPIHEVPDKGNATQHHTGSHQLGLNSNRLEQSPLSHMTNNIGSPDETARQIQIRSDPIVNESANNKKKRVRGPTFMPATWGIQPENRIAVSFNELGQPNDLHKSCTLASFLGVLARNPRYCPLNYDDWRHMPEQFKEDMKTAVKSRFGLTNEHDDFILTSINDKSRKWKNRVKKSNFKNGVSLEQQKLIWSDRVDKDQFMEIVERWSSDKSQKEELGRYPRRAEIYERCFYKPDGSPTSNVVRDDVEKMKEVYTQDPQVESNGILHNKDDEFAKVKGHDKDGQVRMYGMGVRAVDVYGKKPTRASLLRENMKYKQVLDNLTAEMEMLKEHEQGNSRTSVEQDVERNLTPSPNRQPNPPHRSSGSQNNNGSSASVSRPSRIKVGSYVVLKSLINNNEIVASGYVREMGGVRVNGMTLGAAFYNVVVQSIYKKDEPLAFPYDFVQTMEDAIGAPVAWPLTSISLSDDDD